MTLRPFFSFFGGKWTLAPRYPAPAHEVLVEPFAGSAGYATRYPDRRVVLVEKDPVVAGVWRYLLRAKPSEVLRLPLDPELRHQLPPEPRALVGFWLGRARTQPANTSRSAWLRSGRWPSSFWGEYARARIAAQVDRIRHWRLIEGDYRAAPDVAATWFVDPPYVSSRHYRAKVGDYAELGDWCRSRRGLVIVCEAADERADWLPFKHFHDARSINRAVSTEVAWVQDDGS